MVGGSFLITLYVLDREASSYEDGVDRPTERYRVVELGAKNDFQACMSKCENDGQCASWVYLKISATRPAPGCLLLPVVPAKTKNPCCMSGVVRR